MAGRRLRVVDLRVAYRSAVAVDGVSFDVAAGSVLTVCGPNGAGKSSLLRAISGLLGLHGGRLTGGRVEVEGDGPVGHVLEGRRVFADLSVEENLRAGAFTLPRGQRAPRVTSMLERFPLLAARRTVRAGHLSGGEQQLLVIARGLVASPAVLLLDEPTVGLARAAIDLVAGVVAEVVAASGAAVVVTEQEPVLFPAATVLRLDRGRTVMDRAPACVPPTQ